METLKIISNSVSEICFASVFQTVVLGCAKAKRVLIKKATIVISFFM
jgi:hypothetical protein